MADGIAIVSLVAVNNGRVRHLLQQQGACRAISDLTTGEQESERSALTVGEGMDLGGSSASGSAYGLIFLPPLPPEAHRCALTAELSIRTSAGGPPEEAKAWNTLTQTPFSAHRTNRL